MERVRRIFLVAQAQLLGKPYGLWSTSKLWGKKDANGGRRISSTGRRDLDRVATLIAGKGCQAT